MKITISLFPAPALLTWPVLALNNVRIDEITGVKGTFNKDEKVFKITSPRGDIEITADEWKIPATFSSTTGAMAKPQRWRKRSMPPSPGSKANIR